MSSQDHFICSTIKELDADDSAGTAVFTTAMMRCAQQVHVLALSYTEHR